MFVHKINEESGITNILNKVNYKCTAKKVSMINEKNTYDLSEIKYKLKIVNCIAI